ncbi:50S ribosomal protein L13 [bacterium]|nr:50S ribosomal protein L13 [bacterium]
MIKRKVHIIDATDQVLGRLASKISLLLQGKNKPNFRPHEDVGDIVIVRNVDKIRITGKKAKEKKYYRHSGYLGGLKEIPFEKLFKKDPAEVLRKAVWGMLPKNRLRARRIKRLKFE